MKSDSSSFWNDLTGITFKDKCDGGIVCKISCDCAARPELDLSPFPGFLWFFSLHSEDKIIFPNTVEYNEISKSMYLKF